MTPERDQQIMDAFLHAIELPANRRVQYLDRIFTSDPSLHVEVESLLQHHIPETLVASEAPVTRKTETNPPKKTRRDVIPANLLNRFRRWRFGVAAIIVAIAIGGIWYLTHSTVRKTLRQNVQSQLQTVLDADVAAVEIWLTKQQETAERWADQPGIRKSLAELERISTDPGVTTTQLERTPSHGEFLDAIAPLLAKPEVNFVGVFARNGHGIAKCPMPLVDDVYWSPKGAALIAPCFQGRTVFIPTFKTGTNVVGAPEGFVLPSVSVVAPVRNVRGEIIAAMQLIMRIDIEFASLFSVARLGETGDAYAFDAQGTVLTHLPRVELLRNLGLIEDNQYAPLNLQLRDPGIDLRTNAPSKGDLDAASNRRSQPICKVPAAAIATGEAMDPDGYRNYLGTHVVGAAKWFNEHHFGVATEFEYDEAYAPLLALSSVFGGVLALLAGVSILLFLNNLWLREKVAQKRRLGQYTLGPLIGQGGMAKVYMASHAMLRRPTAIKLIENNETDPQVIARFEREVQLTSELTHPNTIQIYDYGRTEDGVFYFAMEYLPGVSLAELVAREGALPPARMIYILRQICQSLQEAHGKGIVHQDIKPANIMICERGGQFDFVKVLDFGLVSRRSAENVDFSEQVWGTPLYLAPERLQPSSDVDSRSDVYSLGTVAFYLLTGMPPFDGETPARALYSVMNDQPREPSEVSRYRIPEKLNSLVLDCLAKDPDNRPNHVGILIQILESLEPCFPWTLEDAKSAWEPCHSIEDRDVIEEPHCSPSHA